MWRELKIILSIIQLAHYAYPLSLCWLIDIYAYVSGNFSWCKTVYLAHINEPKTKSEYFVQIIHIFWVTSIWMNTGLITINLLIVNTGPSGSLFITKLSTWHICKPQSLDFLRRLMVIMEPKSCPWAWTNFPENF